MKNKIMLPFLAILFTTLVASFMSKSDETLFKEFQKGFKPTKLPLMVEIVTDTLNDKNKIDAKFSEFFSEDMKERKYSRMSMRVHNEYLQMVAQNENFVAVIVGTSREISNVRNSKGNGNYTKLLVVYDKKGNILDSKQIAYKYSNRYIYTEILSNLAFTTQRFVSGNEKETNKWSLEKTESFMITDSGKIVNVNEKDVKKQSQIQSKSI